MTEGWVCPKCGRVNAPFIDHCLCQDNNKQMPLFQWPYFQPYYLYRPWDGEIIVTCNGGTTNYSIKSSSKVI